jgi:hypothetical protein
MTEGIMYSMTSRILEGRILKLRKRVTWSTTSHPFVVRVWNLHTHTHTHTYTQTHSHTLTKHFSVEGKNVWAWLTTQIIGIIDSFKIISIINNTYFIFQILSYVAW